MVYIILHRHVLDTVKIHLVNDGKLQKNCLYGGKGDNPFQKVGGQTPNFDTCNESFKVL